MNSKCKCIYFLREMSDRYNKINVKLALSSVTDKIYAVRLIIWCMLKHTVSKRK